MDKGQRIFSVGAAWITKCIPDGQPWKGYLQGRVSDPTFWLHVTSRVSNPGRVIYVEGHTPPQI